MRFLFAHVFRDGELKAESFVTTLETESAHDLAEVKDPINPCRLAVTAFL
jgi:hypothetical protein